MRRIIEASLLYRVLTACAGWIDRQWSASNLSRLFRPTDRDMESAAGASGGSGSLLGGLCHRLHLLWSRIFRILRIDRLLEGSVTCRSCFWMALAAVMAPILPTMAVLGLVMLAFASMALRYGRERERSFPRLPVVKWVCLFAAMELISTALSVTLAGSLRGGLLTTAFVLFALAVMDACRERRELERLMRLLVLAGAVVAAIGIMQAALGMESTEAWVDKDDFSDITLRVYSTLENPNVLSEYLLLVIPLAAAGVYTAKTPNGKLLSGLCAGAMVACLVLTWSRGGWLALAVGAAVFLVLMDRRFIVLGILGLLAVLAVLPESIMTRLASIGDMGDSSTSYRVYIWMASLNMLKDYWLCGFGTGVAAFQSVYPRYSFNAVSAPHSHNLFLQVFCENGILGLIAILGTFCSLAVSVGKTLSASDDRRTKVQAGAVAASLAGFAVQSMTDYSFYNYRVMLMFWTLVGIGAALYGIALREART